MLTYYIIMLNYYNKVRKMTKLLTEKFQEYLVDSGFEIGDTIPKELELAEIFGVSRGDIREVIQHYAQLGLLKRIKRKGTVIQKLEEKNLTRSFSFCIQMGGFYYEELKEVRLLLESAIAPYIINRITPADLELLENNLRKQEEALDRNEEFEILDREFHSLLFACCRNRFMGLFASLLPMIFKRKYRERFFTRPWRETGLNMHRKIISALREGDLKTFTNLITEHISTT